MPVQDFIQTLKDAALSEQLTISGSEEFNKLNSSYLSRLQSDLQPSAIYLPSSKNDVVSFVQLIKPFVLDGDVQFAIRGAGQQPVPGCSNITNGITPDLRNLKAIEVKNQIVSVGAGERWGPIYEALAEHGLGVGGSRSALGGVGGLALAGGLSFFSSREGFICDNVVNYEVVPSFPSQIQAYCDELNKQDPDKETHIMISQGYSAAFAELSGHFCMNQLYYTHEVEKPPVLEPFISVQPQIEPMNSWRMLTLKDAANKQAAQSSDGVRCAYIKHDREGRHCHAHQSLWNLHRSFPAFEGYRGSYMRLHPPNVP